MPSIAAEKMLRATLWEFGVRFRTNEEVLGAIPSITVPNCKVAIFVLDCYEDRCPWHFPNRPNTRYFKALDARDAKLKKADWTVLRVWQHEIQDTPRIVAGRISMVIRTLRKILNKVR